jgi:inosine/xanthosine triphosphate pyrophosphatase family protein
MKKKKAEPKPKAKGYHYCEGDNDTGFMTPKEQQLKMRERGYGNKRNQVNSDYIFKHPDYKKNTKGYDEITGEIDKRGRPADNQDEIFVKKPEPDKTFAELQKDKKKSEAKKLEAYNKKLYRDRLKTKWDRGW